MKQNRLFNLFARNAKKGSFRAQDNTIFIYDVIVSSDAEAEYFGGVSPEAFSRALAGINGDVHLRINSPGGDVFAARAMAAAMREHNGQIIAHVDGYAASAASLIAVSANRAIMAEGSFLMIHKAWTLGYGNANDLIATAALLDKIDGSLAETYARKSGGDVAEFTRMMAEETWFSAQEAVEARLADEMQSEAPTEDGAAKNAWDLSVYSRAPAPADGGGVQAAEQTRAQAKALAALPDLSNKESDLRVRKHAARMVIRTA
ncbi:MAG: Clp protease ClpP [Beijerinckiaceae bacterium]|nr:Clp protease ClpP [Beijerinckiaceae bacterium]